MLDGVTVVNKKLTKCDYDVPKTIGFYLLRNTFLKVTQPTSTYLMVSDANAPVPLYSGDKADKDRYFLLNDARLVKKELKDVSLKIDGVTYTWQSILDSNTAYHANRSLSAPTGSIADAKDLQSLGQDTSTAKSIIFSIFNGFRNPYEKVTLVLANRTGANLVEKKNGIFSSSKTIKNGYAAFKEASGVAWNKPLDGSVAANTKLYIDSKSSD